MDRTQSSRRVGWIAFLGYLAICALLLGTM